MDGLETVPGNDLSWSQLLPTGNETKDVVAVLGLKRARDLAKHFSPGEDGAWDGDIEGIVFMTGEPVGGSDEAGVVLFVIAVGEVDGKVVGTMLGEGLPAGTGTTT